MECETVPEFELPAYEGIEVEVEKFKATDEEVAGRLETMRQMHTEMIDRPAGRSCPKRRFCDHPL